MSSTTLTLTDFKTNDLQNLIDQAASKTHGNPSSLEKSFYDVTYHAMLHCVQSLPLTEQGSIASAVLAYGWMPTSPKKIEPKALHRLLQNIRQLPPQDVIWPRNSPINGSWVGLSKVLHLHFPESFPIWDSQVALHFGLKHAYQVNNRESFLLYTKNMRTALNNLETDHLRRALEEHAGGPLSKMRVAEYALFLLSKQKKD